jgi:hypothetical protein
MASDEPRKLPAAWSPEKLSQFHKFINSLLPVSFTILEKQKSTTFLGRRNLTTTRSPRTSHVSYRGFIHDTGFENISVILNPVRSLAEEYKNFIGYIEIANSAAEETIPAAEIRMSIREDLGIGEILNEMLTEAKIFHSKMSPVYIYLESSYCLKDKPPELLLKSKIPIREMSTFQKISCLE